MIKPTGDKETNLHLRRNTFCTVVFFQHVRIYIKGSVPASIHTITVTTIIACKSNHYPSSAASIFCAFTAQSSHTTTGLRTVNCTALKRKVQEGKKENKQASELMIINKCIAGCCCASLLPHAQTRATHVHSKNNNHNTLYTKHNTQYTLLTCRWSTSC